jgi:hypothetical protein
MDPFVRELVRADAPRQQNLDIRPIEREEKRVLEPSVRFDNERTVDDPHFEAGTVLPCVGSSV